MDAAAAPATSGSSWQGTRLGHRPVIDAYMGEVPVPAEEWVIAALAAAGVPDISDAVGRLYTMSAKMRPLYMDMPRLVGTAVTVKAVPGDNWAIHGGLSVCGSGHVLVVDWQGYTEGAGSGVQTLVPAVTRGLKGVVIDGSWRDVTDVKALGLPIVGRGISPFSPAKVELGEVNVPVCCGGVIVCPGDIVVGDEEGTVVVPRRCAEVVARAVKPFVRRLSLDDYPDTLLAPSLELGEAYRQALDGQGRL